MELKLQNATLEVVMNETKRAFWVVWNPNGRTPIHRHDSENSAVNEAERLAKHCPGEKFFVLQATALRTIDAMQRVLLIPGAIDECEVPF